MRDANDEPIYTYNDKYMSWFVRQNIKGGRVCSFNQYYKSKICDDALKILSEELNVKGNVYDNIESYMKYKIKHFRVFEKENENQFDDYTDEDEEQNEKYIN